MSDFGNKEVFSSNLRKYVEMSGKTRRDIARELNIKESGFNSWCRGEYYPRIDKIEILADYFCCLKSDLIERNQNTFSKEKNEIMKFINDCSDKDADLILGFIKLMEGSGNNE